MKLKDYCIKEGKEYLLSEWDDEKICRSTLKRSVQAALFRYGGNVKKVIRGRHRCEAVQKRLQDARNVLHQSFPKRESNRPGNIQNVLNPDKVNKF